MSLYKNSFLAVVVVFLCANSVNCASSQRTNANQQPNCELVRPFFEMRNITYEGLTEDTYGPVCSGKCCSAATESALRLQVRRDFSSLLRHNSRSLQGLLDTTATTLQDHMTSLTRQSENKTLSLFSKVYQEMAFLSHDPITLLYSDIRQSIQVNDTQDSFTTSNVDIKSSVIKFFTDIFPLVFHHNLNSNSRDFADDYKVCLREIINEVKPFGDIPRQISESLSKSLEATRLLLQAFNVGEEVLNTTETLLSDDASKLECHNALVKMSYCPKCLGLKGDSKPCSGYCLNVLRGCLTRHVSELDSAWNEYVEGIERLVVAWKQHNNEAGVNADAVVRALETRISAAIMYAMGIPDDLGKMVTLKCGAPKWSDKENEPSTTTNASITNGKSTKTQKISMSIRDNPPPETQLLHFLTSIAKSRGFYSNLANNLCQDDSFAETKDQNCWNGERIGEYGKPIVDARLGNQKYNPELKISSDVQDDDPRIANMADKLHHVHNMVITSLGTVKQPESDNLMQGDAADGSGSGHGGPWDVDDDDGVSGSGSGHGSIESGVVPGITGNHQPKPKLTDNQPKASGSSLLSASVLTILLVSLLHMFSCSG